MTLCFWSVLSQMDSATPSQLRLIAPHGNMFIPTIPTCGLQQTFFAQTSDNFMVGFFDLPIDHSLYYFTDLPPAPILSLFYQQLYVYYFNLQIVYFFMLVSLLWGGLCECIVGPPTHPLERDVDQPHLIGLMSIGRIINSCIFINCKFILKQPVLCTVSFLYVHNYHDIFWL